MEILLSLQTMFLTMILLSLLWLVIKVDRILQSADAVAQELKALRNRSESQSEAAANPQK